MGGTAKDPARRSEARTNALAVSRAREAGGRRRSAFRLGSTVSGHGSSESVTGEGGHLAHSMAHGSRHAGENGQRLRCLTHSREGLHGARRGLRGGDHGADGASDHALDPDRDLEPTPRQLERGRHGKPMRAPNPPSGEHQAAKGEALDHGPVLHPQTFLSISEHSC